MFSRKECSTMADVKARRWLTLSDSYSISHFLGKIRVKSTTRSLLSTNTANDLIRLQHDEAEHETSVSIFPARWLMHLGLGSGLRISLSNSSIKGWKHTLSTFCVVPDDALIFKYSKEGNISAIKDLLLEGRASIRDIDSHGWTPLHVSNGVKIFIKWPLKLRFEYASRHHHPKLCKLLVVAGADQSILDAGDE